LSSESSLRALIRAAALSQAKNRRLSFLEKRCWKVAEQAPFGARLIADEQNGPYLLRIYLTPENRSARHRMPRFYLHYFFRGDADRDVHNHPWPHALSLILTGGYTEYRWDRDRRRLCDRIYLPGMVNRIRRDDFHRVEMMDPEAGCWTLFMSYGRVAPSDGTDWGFLDTDTSRFTPWGQYLAQKEQGQ
jgi:hypothetical protein